MFNGYQILKFFLINPVRGECPTKPKAKTGVSKPVLSRLKVISKGHTNEKIKKRISLITFFFLIVFSPTAQPLIVGSNTVVSRQDAPTFPSSGTDNTMQGFAHFEEGFILEDSTTTCTFDSFFPVSGDVTLKGGTLYLQRDLVLTGSIRLSGGHIVGNGYKVEFPHSAATNFIPSAYITPGSITGVSLLDSENISDDVFSVDWSYDGNYLAVGRDSNTGTELRVFYFNGSTLTLKDQVEISYDVNCVCWHPSQHYLAVGCNTSTNGLRIYSFNTGTETLSNTDNDMSDQCFAVAWHPDGDHLVVGGNSSPEVRLFSFNDGSGTISQLGTYDPGGADVQRGSASFSPDGSYVALGFGGSEVTEEIVVYEFTGSALSENASVTFSYDVETVEWCPSLDNHLIIGLDGGTERFRLYEHNPGGGTLTEVTSGRVGESSNAIWQAHWDSTGEYLAYGQAMSNYDRFKIYSFDSSAKTFTNVVDEQISLSGTTRHVRAIRWSPNDDYLATGSDYNLVRVHSITRLADDATMASLFLEDLALEINSSVKATLPWKFIDTCTIYGNGNTISIDDDAGLVVAPGAHLILDNVILKDLSNGKLICLHDNSSITLRNSVLQLSSDYTFSKGSLIFEKDVVISGTTKFNYTTDQASTIASQSTLYVDDGMTFKYAPCVANKNLLVMEDATSILFLNGATLHVTYTGLKLSTGTLYLDNKVTLSCEGRNSGEAFEFASDFDVKLLGGAVADVHGIFKYV